MLKLKKLERVERPDLTCTLGDSLKVFIFGNNTDKHFHPRYVGGGDYRLEECRGEIVGIKWEPKMDMECKAKPNQWVFKRMDGKSKKHKHKIGTGNDLELCDSKLKRKRW